MPVGQIPTILYPDLQQPLPAPQQESRWHQPWSEPVRRKGIATALIVASGMTFFWNPETPAPVQRVTFQTTSPQVAASHFLYPSVQEPVPITAAVVDVDGWYQPLAEPVRFRKLHVSLYPAVPRRDLEETGLDKWHIALSDPVRRRNVPIAQDYVAPVFFGEIVTVDKWFANLSEPVRVKLGLLTARQQFATSDTEPAVSFGWQQWLSEPVRLKLGLPATQQQFFATDTEPIVSFSWFAPLPEPVRLKPGLGANQQQFFATDTEPLVSFSWYGALSEPSVKAKRPPTPTDIVYPLVVAETVTVDKWFGWLSDPVRLKPGLTARLQSFFAADTEPTVSFGWAYGLSDPVRIKLGLGAHLQQALTIDPWLLTQPEAVLESKWHQGWPDFATRKTQPHPSQQQTLAFWPFPITGEVVTLDKWYQEFSQPVRVKLGLLASAQQFLAIDPFILTQPERVSEDKWHQPWSEPVRRAGLKTNLQSSYAAPIFVTETVTVDKWFGWLSDPVRQKPGLGVALQQSFTTDAEPQVAFSWFGWLSDPVRVKVGLQASQQAFFTIDTEPTVSFSWSDGLSEPVRVRLFQAAQQQPLAWSSFTPAAQDIRWFTSLSEPVRVRYLHASQQQAFQPDTKPTVSFGWFGWLSEPVRQKPGLAAQQQQFLEFQPTPIVSIGWYAPWSEPSVKALRLPAAQQPYLAWSSFTPAATTEDQWHQPWSEPVRIKRALSPGAQFFTIGQPTTVVNFSQTWTDVQFSTYRLFQGLAEPIFTQAVVPEDRWHQPWSEPVRLKRGLGVHLQPVTQGEIKPRVSFAWYEWLSDPVRLKRGTGSHLQPFAQADTKPKVSFGWYGRLSEPVRVKLGLRTSAQQFLAFVKAAPFPETVTESRWHQPWSEPVRYRRFSPAHQQFLAHSPRITSQNITVSLDATETGDTFSGLLNIVFCFHSNVSVVQVDPGPTAVGSAYVQNVFANVSVVEVGALPTAVGSTYGPDVQIEPGPSYIVTVHAAFQPNAFQNNAFQTADPSVFQVLANVSVCEIEPNGAIVSVIEVC